MKKLLILFVFLFGCRYGPGCHYGTEREQPKQLEQPEQQMDKNIIQQVGYLLETLSNVAIEKWSEFDNPDGSKRYCVFLKDVVCIKKDGIYINFHKAGIELAHIPLSKEQKEYVAILYRDIGNAKMIYYIKRNVKGEKE